MLCSRKRPAANTPTIRPKLPPLFVDICALTCDNVEESKAFLDRKSATTTGYHDVSLRWSDM
jgi:hypothetical protein